MWSLDLTFSLRPPRQPLGPQPLARALGRVARELAVPVEPADDRAAEQRRREPEQRADRALRAAPGRRVRHERGRRAARRPRATRRRRPAEQLRTWSSVLATCWRAEKRHSGDTASSMRLSTGGIFLSPDKIVAQEVRSHQDKMLVTDERHQSAPLSAYPLPPPQKMNQQAAESCLSPHT